MTRFEDLVGRENDSRQRHEAGAVAWSSLRDAEIDQPPGTGFEQWTPVYPDDLYRSQFPRFGFIDMTVIATGVMVRFRWLPDQDDQQYLLYLEYPDPDSWHEGLFDAEIDEQISTLIDHSGAWKADAVRISPSLSIYLPSA